MPAKGDAPIFGVNIRIIFLSGCSAKNFNQMNRLLLFSAFFCFFVNCAWAQIKKTTDTTLLQSIEINSVRAADNNPIAKTTLNKKEITKRNIGYDLPFILNQTPSIQVNSDAGNGIGYTGIRIRGTDASRINITLNGIPFNDPESQGTFLVNLPDFASSANAIQIQRGIGSSTNGSGAFGGSININTNDLDTSQYITASNSIGSYQSVKNTLVANSGLLKKHFIFSGRLSNISSNGYIDRSNSRLQSFFTSASYVDKEQTLRVNIFSAKEKTHAAWFGINQTTLDTNRRYNPAGTEKAGDPYDNETDNYRQTHYQLFYNRKINDYVKLNLGVFLIKGKGYFEQYKKMQALADYGLPAYSDGTVLVDSTDLVRRPWLDNQFYGSTFSAEYNRKNTDFIIGSIWSSYDGKHFGEIINSAVSAAVPENYKWYDVAADKKEFSVFTKWTQKLNTHWQTYLDVQFRKVTYTIHGFEKNPSLLTEKDYSFFNPKAGITYAAKNWKVYFSYAKATKEPNRDDFEANTNELPHPETLHDFEIGFEGKSKKYNWGLNLYYMLYKDQLVLTGKVNDVYAYTRSNISDSYRAGIELQAGINITKWLKFNSNMTFSINKIKDFTEYIDNYDNNVQEIKQYSSSDISYSPSVIGAGEITITPIKHIELSMMSKYIGKQFLDNTSNDERILRDYFTEDFKISFSKPIKNEKILDLFIQVNNIFSKKYVSNGWTFSYISGGDFTTENYYFPMALINLMAGFSITL